MGCMMVGDCKEGVEEITKWEDLGPQYESFSDELSQLIAGLIKQESKFSWQMTKFCLYD